MNLLKKNLKMKIETEKIEIKKGSIVQLKIPKVKGTILDIIQGDKVVLQLMLENDVEHFCFSEDVEKVIK
jgi:hypothetical protein